MVAVLLLAVGMLASSGLQILSLRANQESHFAGRAGLLAESTIDRIRRNPEGLQAGAYKAADTRVAGEVACQASPCSPEQLAASDIAHWATRLAPDIAGALPELPPLVDGGPAFGTISVSADGLYLVTQSWGGLIDGKPADQSVTTGFRP